MIRSENKLQTQQYPEVEKFISSIREIPQREEKNLLSGKRITMENTFSIQNRVDT